MAYTIYHADGTAVPVPNAIIDSIYYNATGGNTGNGLGIQLIGDRAVDYGGPIAQNFLQMTENFASNVIPSDTTSLQGQLWFNKLSPTAGDLYVRKTSNTSGGIVNWEKLITANISGTITGNITGNAATATTATNVAGGAAGSLVYQTSAGTTSFIAGNTSGYVLTSTGPTTAPTWQATAPGGVTNIVAGANITISPPSGIGAVTISSTGGGGGTATTEFDAGSIVFFASVAAPSGYLIANGALVSRTTYAELFAAIGTTFGVGDGSTTFGLPDLRGEFVRAWDAGRGVDAGRVFGSAQLDEFKSHTHGTSGMVTNSAGAHTHSITQLTSYSEGAPPGAQELYMAYDGSNLTPYPLTTVSAGAHTHTITGTIDATGGIETRPRNIALLGCIKVANTVTVGSAGTVTSVGVTTTPSRITVSGSPVTTSGNIALDLATTGVTAGSYTNTSMTVDAYGRVTSAANGVTGSGLGYGQTWQVVTRVAGTTYYNTTGKPIVFQLVCTSSGGGAGLFAMTIDGLAAGYISPIPYQGGGGSYTGADCFIVPDAASYMFTFAGFGTMSTSAYELR